MFNKVKNSYIYAFPPPVPIFVYQYLPSSISTYRSHPKMSQCKCSHNSLLIHRQQKSNGKNKPTNKQCQKSNLLGVGKNWQLPNISIQHIQSVFDYPTHFLDLLYSLCQCPKINFCELLWWYCLQVACPTNSITVLKASVLICLEIIVVYTSQLLTCKDNAHNIGQTSECLLFIWQTALTLALPPADWCQLLGPEAFLIYSQSTCPTYGPPGAKKSVM